MFYSNDTPPRRGTGSGPSREEGRSNNDGGDSGDEYMEDDNNNNGSGADIENRYHSLYEQRMNPFDQVILTE